MGPFGKYMVFETQLYEIWKLTFNVKSYIFFMHSEPTPYFVSRLASWVSRSTTSLSLCQHGPKLNCWKTQRSKFDLPKKTPYPIAPVMSYIWDFPSLSFDTHFSYLSSLCHWGEAENRVYFSKISLISV